MWTFSPWRWSHWTSWRRSGCPQRSTPSPPLCDWCRRSFFVCLLYGLDAALKQINSSSTMPLDESYLVYRVNQDAGQQHYLFQKVRLDAHFHHGNVVKVLYLSCRFDDVVVFTSIVEQTSTCQISMSETTFLSMLLKRCPPMCVVCSNQFS